MSAPFRRCVGGKRPPHGDNQRVRRLPSIAALACVALVTASCGGGSASLEPNAGTSSLVESAASPGATASPSATGVVTIPSADIPAPAPAVITLPDSSPRRIVSLASGAAETLAALGVGDRVVGRDEASDVPQISAAPIVTKAHATSAEKVLALQPDLVIVDAATAPLEALGQISDAGVRVVEIPEAWTLADIAARTTAIAEAVGIPPDAAASVIAEATSAGGATPQADAPRVAFLYLRGTSAIYLVGGSGSGADALVEAAGGIDAGAAAGYEAFVPLTAEAVAALDPDVLLVMTKGLESVGGIDGLVGLPGVAQTPAGRDRRVVAVDDTLLLSFGPRTGALIEALRTSIGTGTA